MISHAIAGHVLTPHGFVRGRVHISDGRITGVEGEPVDEPQLRSTDLPIILPGFVDLHVHGGGGRDTMEGGDALEQIARLHAQHGTTSMLATTMTAAPDDIETALRAIGAASVARAPNAARVLGAHLEGPYINPGKLGAQPDCARAGSLDELARWCELAPVRLVTLAPEMSGHLALIQPLQALGMRVQIGHSAGSYEDGVAALAQGATGFAHLFNAMSGLHHRAPGMVGAALAHARYAELIPDLLHVHPGAILAALRAIPCLYCVTDSTAAAGMPDGAYRLGSHTVTKCLGGVRLADGTLAGSTLTMDQALRNLVGLGLDWADAARRTSTHAADFLGLHDRGRIAVGAWADLVLVDSHLNLSRVVVEGVEIDLADAR